MSDTDDLATQHLDKVEDAMRQARDLLRSHDGDVDAQSLAVVPALFEAVHALWGWAIATSGRIDISTDRVDDLESRVADIDGRGI